MSKLSIKLYFRPDSHLMPLRDEYRKIDHFPGKKTAVFVPTGDDLFDSRRYPQTATLNEQDNFLGFPGEEFPDIGNRHVWKEITRKAKNDHKTEHFPVSTSVLLPQLHPSWDGVFCTIEPDFSSDQNRAKRQLQISFYNIFVAAWQNNIECLSIPLIGVDTAGGDILTNHNKNTIIAINNAIGYFKRFYNSKTNSAPSESESKVFELNIVISTSDYDKGQGSGREHLTAAELVKLAQDDHRLKKHLEISFPPQKIKREEQKPTKTEGRKIPVSQSAPVVSSQKPREVLVSDVIQTQHYKGKSIVSYGLTPIGDQWQALCQGIDNPSKLNHSLDNRKNLQTKKYELYQDARNWKDAIKSAASYQKTGKKVTYNPYTKLQEQASSRYLSINGINLPYTDIQGHQQSLTVFVENTEEALITQNVIDSYSIKKSDGENKSNPESIALAKTMAWSGKGHLLTKGFDSITKTYPALESPVEVIFTADTAPDLRVNKSNQSPYDVNDYTRFVQDGRLNQKAFRAAMLLQVRRYLLTQQLSRVQVPVLIAMGASLLDGLSEKDKKIHGQIVAECYAQLLDAYKLYFSNFKAVIFSIPDPAQFSAYQKGFENYGGTIPVFVTNKNQVDLALLVKENKLTPGVMVQTTTTQKFGDVYDQELTNQEARLARTSTYLWTFEPNMRMISNPITFFNLSQPALTFNQTYTTNFSTTLSQPDVAKNIVFKQTDGGGEKIYDFWYRGGSLTVPEKEKTYTRNDATRLFESMIRLVPTSFKALFPLTSDLEDQKDVPSLNDKQLLALKNHTDFGKTITEHAQAYMDFLGKNQRAIFGGNEVTEAANITRVLQSLNMLDPGGVLHKWFLEMVNKYCDFHKTNITFTNNGDSMLIVREKKAATQPQPKTHVEQIQPKPQPNEDYVINSPDLKTILLSFYNTKEDKEDVNNRFKNSMDEYFCIAQKHIPDLLKNMGYTVKDIQVLIPAIINHPDAKFQAPPASGRAL